MDKIFLIFPQFILLGGLVCNERYGRNSERQVQSNAKLLPEQLSDLHSQNLHVILWEMTALTDNFALIIAFKKL